MWIHNSAMYTETCIAYTDETHCVKECLTVTTLCILHDSLYDGENFEILIKVLVV